MTKAYNNSLLARTISVSGTNTTVSGLLISTSGNFTDSLRLNNINVSISGHNHIIGDVTGLQTALDGKQAAGNYAASSHTHTSSNITDFNSVVSGLLPVTNITAGTGIGISSSSGNFTVSNNSPIVNYTTSNSFPTTGVSGYYYLDSDSGRLYQWTGSYYAEIGPPISSVNNAQNAANLYLWSNFK